jgi:hypothetical protein
MGNSTSFKFVTVGTSPGLVKNLWDRIAAAGGYSISHIVHPSFDRNSWSDDVSKKNIHFLRDDMRLPLPAPDRELLASLEQEGVPTIHNMILSDRMVSKLTYHEALSYATLLTRRLMLLYQEVRPSIVIGGFDALHGSLGFAVAKTLKIPWCALLFSSIPSGKVAVCTDLSPASMVTLGRVSKGELRQEADKLLRDFEERKIQAAAYIPPTLLSPSYVIRRIPGQLNALRRVAGRRKLKQHLKFTDPSNSYSVAGLFREAFRLRKNVWALHHKKLLTAPGEGRYAFFGLHTQPESSIDVFAHFFSNQVRVIELMSRSLPPTHRLLVKLHKSDAPNYSTAALAALSRFPAVELVSPYADTYGFIKAADIVFSIQGTIGLEGALLGKPVVMFGDSPVKMFPTVASVGTVTDLPRLVRAQLDLKTKPNRSEIVDALAGYIAAFFPASPNDWSVVPSQAQIDGYVQLFAALARSFEDMYVRRLG